jgi:thiol-disulfide isomerase/thioredoxin
MTQGGIVITALIGVVVGTGLVSGSMPWQDADPVTREVLLDSINAALDAERFEGAEADMARFRELFPPSTRVRGWGNGNEVMYLFMPTLRLAAHYERGGELDKALQVYSDELSVLTMDVPHYSWRFAAAIVPLLLALEKKDKEECRQFLEELKEQLEARAEEVTSPARKELFQDRGVNMASALHHLDLVGRPAPDFRFDRAINADPSLSLKDLRGKIVLIDFWAAWCVPCLAAWPSLRELREEHVDRGFEILSITSLVESYGPQFDLTEAKELEVGADRVEELGVKWPVLYSDRPANDPEYAATTLPTYVVVNRDGNVAAVIVGDFGGLARHVIERLLEDGPLGTTK